MNKIKAICFNNINYCKFPDGVDNIKDFIRYMNEHYNSFVELEFFSEEGCIAPFFIEENGTDVQYWNPAQIRMIEESEITILTRDEYYAKLKEMVAQKCIHCIHYTEDGCEQDMDSYCEKLSLSGECYGFEKNK